MNPSGGHILPSMASFSRLKKCKHHAVQTKETGVSRKDGHGVDAPFTDRNMTKQENAETSQFPRTFSFFDKPLPEIPEVERQVLQPSAPKLGPQSLANLLKLSITETQGTLIETPHQKSTQHHEDKPANPLTEKQRNSRMALTRFSYRSAGKAKEQASHLEVASRLPVNKANSSRRAANPAALHAPDGGMIALARAHNTNHFSLFGLKRSPEDQTLSHSNNDSDEPRNTVAKITSETTSHFPSLPKPSLPYKNKRKTLSISTPTMDDSVVNASPKARKILGFGDFKEMERSKDRDEFQDELEETIIPKSSRGQRSFSTNDLSNLIPKTPTVQLPSAAKGTQPFGIKGIALAALDSADPAAQQCLEHMKRAKLQISKEFNSPAPTTHMLEDSDFKGRPSVENNGSDKIYDNGTGWVEPEDRPQELHPSALAPLDDPIVAWRRGKGRLMNLLPNTMEFAEPPARVREYMRIQENSCESPMDDITEAQIDIADLWTERTSSPMLVSAPGSVHDDANQEGYASTERDAFTTGYMDWETLQKLASSRASSKDGESTYISTNEFPDGHSTPCCAYDASSKRQAIRLDQSHLKAAHRAESSLSRYDVDESMADAFYQKGYGSGTFADCYHQDLHLTDGEMENDTLAMASCYNYPNRLSIVPEENHVSKPVKRVSDSIKRSSIDAGLLIEELNTKKKRPNVKIQIPEFAHLQVNRSENYVEDIIQAHGGAAESPITHQANEISEQKEYQAWCEASDSPYKYAASVPAAESKVAEQQVIGPLNSSGLTPFPSFARTSTADPRYSNSPIALYKRTSSPLLSHYPASPSPRSSNRHSIRDFGKDFLAKNSCRNSAVSGRASISRPTPASLMAAREMEKMQLVGNSE